MKPPMPRVSRSMSARLLGHLGDLGVVDLLLDPTGAKARDGAMSYRMLQRTPGWYAETASKTFRLDMAGKTVIFTKDPAVYKAVLGSQKHHFTTSDGFRKVIEYFDENVLFALKDKQWAHVRKVTTRAMAMQDLDGLPQSVGETIEKCIRRCPRHTTHHGIVVMEPEDVLPQATFDLFHKIMFKWDPDTVSNDADGMVLLRDAMTCASAMAARSGVPLEWLWRLPLAANRKVDAARDALRVNTIAFIEKRLAVLARQADDEGASSVHDASLLDCMLVAAMDGKLTQAELVGQVLSFFFGAFETTSYSIALMLNHVAAHPDVQDRLRADLHAAFPDGKASVTSLAALEQVEYLNWVFDETMRLVPHVFVVPRSCVTSCTIHGVTIDAGDEVLVDTLHASQDEANYAGQTDLDQFRPERFGNVRLNKTATMPFGVGSRMCPGRKIATGELKAFLAYAVMGWKLTRPAGLPFLMDTSLGLGMRKGYGTLLWEPL
ncbi:Aste57867_14242 [Aphanomyces stellatus]|uniref:Aste57867_14242 protein n=1 Tax=Aphanomyces stellatus TaxID=120398 RepID=A0A485L0Y3_9STRA|nr:hypothetical protein As57867_014191 [Aphanomyces stellatus]VFT91067.1 Aste57867_14242 [Aphanomyces stellatus]